MDIIGKKMDKENLKVLKNELIIFMNDSKRIERLSRDDFSKPSEEAIKQFAIQRERVVNAFNTLAKEIENEKNKQKKSR